MSDRPLFVVNPSAGGGKTGATFSELRRVIEGAIGEIDVAFTERPRHAVQIAREAAEAGKRTVVAVGGDGSISEVANGLMLAREAGCEARLGVLGQGTGGDFRRTLGIEHRLDRYCQVLKAGETRRVDIGRFSYVDHDGEPAQAFFINILSVGLSGVVDRYVARTSKALGGSAAYFIASARGLLESAIGRVACSFTQGGETREEELASRTIAICNGRYFGGGMEVAPMAEPDDGCFEVIDLGDAPKLSFALSSSRIYTGDHLKNPRVKHFRADRATLKLRNEEVAERFLLDVDGEPLGRLPLEVELLPGALEVLAPPGRGPGGRVT
jgi:diacylglycerol kinase (ATP)